MFTSRISFTNFKKKIKSKKVEQNLKYIIEENNEITKSLSKNYKHKFPKRFINNYRKYLNFRLIGMGGSSLGTQAIYEFLRDKIKKNFLFIDNLQSKKKILSKKKYVNLVVSKSGNTIETILNLNIIKKKDKNIFITESKKNSLTILADKLKAEVIHHNNFIGGRYSVLSEVGMLPAELMGLNSKKFKQYNALIKNKSFLNSLIQNVSSTLFFLKNKKFNSIIINYDQQSENLFKWYQQLVAESIGKSNKGILPIVSTMPKDNHSLMQLYLDGPRNSFFTFFGVDDHDNQKIINREILPSLNYLKNKNLYQIKSAQKKATETVFRKRNIPFRSFKVLLRSEEAIGELFTFFMLETILLADFMKINPFDQPSVELIKIETKRILTN